MRSGASTSSSTTPGILRDRIFHKMSVADWAEVIAVHLNGSAYLSLACGRRFREQGSGAFVHMTSTSALVGSYGQANYMAAKFGLVGLSRGIALDMARFNVRSNCVAPFAWSRMIESIPVENEIARREVERAKLLKPEAHRAARRVPRLGARESDQRAGVRGAAERNLSVQPAAAGEARCIARKAGRRRRSPRPCPALSRIR